MSRSAARLAVVATVLAATGAVAAVAALASTGHGARGPVGARGPAGAPALHALEQDISINWQNDRPAGRATASFVAPGIGRGVVVCSRDTQWVRFFPYDRDADVELWVVLMRRGEVAVRAAARRSPHYGRDFNIGLNEVKGTEPEAKGALTGIISSRGPFGRTPSSPPPPPTTLRLAWHWSFGDPAARRCYVAGTVLSRGAS